MQVDIKNLLDFRASILPQSATADATGSVVDTQGFNSCVVFGYCDGTASAGSFIVQDCATSGGSFVAVDDAFVITSDGTNDTAATAGGIVTIGVTGADRYLKVFWDRTSTAVVAAGIVLGNPAIAPTGTNS